MQFAPKNESLDTYSKLVTAKSYIATNNTAEDIMKTILEDLKAKNSNFVKQSEVTRQSNKITVTTSIVTYMNPRMNKEELTCICLFTGEYDMAAAIQIQRPLTNRTGQEITNAMQDILSIQRNANPVKLTAQEEDELFAKR